MLSLSARVVCAVLIALLSLWSASPAVAQLGGNNSSSSGGSSGSPYPYGCGVAPPEPPFVLVRDLTLNSSTQSIAIFNGTLYYAEPYDSFTGFVYALDLATLQSLPPIDVTKGAPVLPPLPYSASAFQLRVDDTGRLHLVDLRNAVIICLTADGVWQSVVPGGAGGVWSVDVSPDGDTYFLNELGGGIRSVARVTGAALPFKHVQTASSVAYGPDGTIYLANGNYQQGTTIDRISSNGTVLSSIDLSDYDYLKLDISAMVVDASNTIAFTNRQGSNCNDLCFYFAASGNVTCWEAVAGYDFGLAYDADSGQVTCIRGDEGGLFTFASPDEVLKQATVSPAGSAASGWTVAFPLAVAVAALAAAAVVLLVAFSLLRQRRQGKAAAAQGAVSLLSAITAE